MAGALGAGAVAALLLGASPAAAASSSSSSSPDFCLDTSRGYVTSIASPCPPSTTPFRHAGVNLFDIFWDAWAPTPSSGNLSTSLKAVRDAAAEGVAVARVFSVPWEYSSDWAWLNASTRPAYFAAMDAVLGEAERVGMKLILSLGHGCADGTLACNPARLCPGETYRDLVVNASSCTRNIIRAYAQDVVGRYLDSPAVLFWELGNEINLSFDGCSYDKSDGAFFTAAEGLAFLAEYAADVRAVDPLRPVNTGMAAPRLRAAHLAATPGGGKACVSPANPKGDCDLFCDAVPFDTLENTTAVMAQYYAGFDMVSVHWYSCAPPNGNYTWCPSDDNATTVPLATFKGVADALGKPLYVGEYGPDTTIPGGWGPEPWRGAAYIVAMQGLGVPLSTLWAFECPSHDDMGGLCLHPGDVSANQADTFAVLDTLRSVDRALTGLPPWSGNMTLYWVGEGLPEGASEAAAAAAATASGPPKGTVTGGLAPACLDGSRYGYYAKLGLRTDRWVVMLQGGGWCPDEWNCWLRTLPAYAGGGLGSSTNWTAWSWAYWFGTTTEDYSYLYLPYCDGASYSGMLVDPVPTPYGPDGNATLFFRGAANLESGVLDALARFGIPQGSVKEIIVTGGSAGGLSTTLHVDRLKDLFGAELASGTPQCGYFPAYDAPCEGTSPSIWCNATAQFNATVQMQNATGALPPACVAAQASPADAWRCFLAPVVTPYVESPLFIWQSKFDHFQLEAFADLSCMLAQAYFPPWVENVTCNAADTAAVGAYGELFMQQFSPVLNVSGPFRGVFLTSCVLHGMDYVYLSVEDSSPLDAWNTWHDAVLNPSSAPTGTDFKWVEDLPMPRTDNPLACPPFTFTPPAAAAHASGRGGKGGI
jgi:O-palmitoleoyl-L-serine hydrolase